MLNSIEKKLTQISCKLENLSVLCQLLKKTIAIGAADAAGDAALHIESEVLKINLLVVEVEIASANIEAASSVVVTAHTSGFCAPVETAPAFEISVPHGTMAPLPTPVVETVS